MFAKQSSDQILAKALLLGSFYNGNDATDTGGEINGTEGYEVKSIWLGGVHICSPSPSPRLCKFLIYCSRNTLNAVCVCVYVSHIYI